MSLLKALTNDQLLNRLHDLIRRDHVLETELIAHLGEVDARRLYLGLACPSMFDYCVRLLHFAEAVAYKRIAVARAARQFPSLLSALESGDIHLTGASLIAPHLCAGSAEQWLAIARHATAREIKQRIADQKPKPDVKTSIRRSRLTVGPGVPTASWEGAATRVAAVEVATTTALHMDSDVGSDLDVDADKDMDAEVTTPTLRPAATTSLSAAILPSHTSQPLTPASTPAPTPTKARSEPLGAERYCIRFVADQVVHEQLQELRSLLRHSIPDGDVAKILARAVGVLLEQVRKQKIGARVSPRRARSPQASRPNSSARPQGSASKTENSSRHIPAAIRRAVWSRDAGRCGYVSREGRRCASQQHLEFHHQLPWARCREHTLANISLRCRAHNRYEAELAFGVEHMMRFRDKASARAAAKGPIREQRGAEGLNWI